MVLTIKPNLLCNAICDYCNVPELGKLIKPMQNETIDMIVEKLEDFVQKRGVKKVNVVFHGGEPLLAPDSFYEHAYHCFTGSEVLKDVDMRYSIQTNLTLYHQKKLPHLMKILGDKPLVGTSYDPVSDSRKLGYKKSYEEEFMKSYFLIRSQGAFINVIYPVTKSAFGKEREIYQFYKNLGVISLTIKPMLDYDGKTNEDELYTAQEYGEFLIRFYDEWKKDNYGICVEPFNGWTLKHKTGNGEQLSCYFSGTCSGDMFLVMPNGDIYECCEYTRIRDVAVGNIYKDEFVSLHKNRVKSVTNYTQMMKANACDGCEWWGYCHGYCPIKTHGEKSSDLHYFCDSYKNFFNDVFKEPYGDKAQLDVNKIKQIIREKEYVI